MVSFAPDLPAAPDYPFQSDQSRSISEPRTNTSKEVALKGLASGIGDVVDIAEGYVEGNIKQQLHTGLDDINDQAISRLTEAKNDPSLIDKAQKQQPLPSGLDGLDRKLDTLDMARKGNKYSQTYIDAQRDTLLKQARSDHPGHRDLIDDLNAKYTREDPANKYISSLIGDINSYQVAQNERKNKAETQIWKGINEHWSDAPAMLDAYKAGRLGKDPESAIAKWSFENTKMDYDKKQAADKLAIVKDNHEAEGIVAEENVTKEASRVARTSLENMYTTSGIRAMDLPHAVLNGQAAKLSPQEADQLGSAVLQRKQVASLEFQKWANTPDPKTNKSPAQLLTANRLQEIWKQQSAVFDDTAEMYKNKEFGLASEASRLSSLAEAQTDYKLSSNPNIGYLYLNAKAISKYPGLSQQLGVTTLETPERLKAVHDYFTTDALKAVAPIETTMQPEGKPFTIKQGVDRAETVGFKAPDLADYTKGSLNIADLISNPKVEDEAKRKIATYAFDPSNAGLLDKYAKDTQPEIYSRLYSYGNVKEMHKLGQQDPTLWNNFKTTAYNHFGSSLLHTQLMDLSEIKANPNLSIAWNPTDHQFRVDMWPKAKNKFSPQEDALLQSDYMKAQKSITAINTGLRSISQISKVEHRDANVDALQFMLGAGVSKGTLPHSMLDAIAATGRQNQFKDAE